jgi:aspartate-semialdehyde dehydrogenase
VPHPAAQLIVTVQQALGSNATTASIVLSASAAGHQGVAKLFQQSADLLNARLDLEDDEPQVAFNVFQPREARELAKALAAHIRMLGEDPDRLLLDIVRVPAFHGTGVSLFFPAGATQAEWPERLRSAPGLILVSSEDSAGFVDAVGQEGAITRIAANDSGALIWCAFDAARLAALTAIWIAEMANQAIASN